MQDEAPGSDMQRDALTGLPGMAAVRRRLGDWTGGRGETGEHPRLHLLLLGLRRFDALNLAYGNAAGDAGLVEIAGRLSHFAASELEGPWIAARSGGSNFVLVANQACSRESWHLFASQLADWIARPVVTPAGSLRLTPRIALLRGVDGEDGEALLDRLGQTLAGMSRHQGRRIAWADGEASRPGRTAAQLETDLLHAIDRDQIEILYQPQFSLPADTLTGAEALARWNHPKLGRIGAGALFAIAERTDHVTPLSQHIARLALAGAAGWPDSLRLSLNVTAFELAAESYAGKFDALLSESGFPPGRLTLEVTEQTLLSDIQQAARVLGELSARGVRVALDDFGAGFCNFRYLKMPAAQGLPQARPQRWSRASSVTTNATSPSYAAILAMARRAGSARWSPKGSRPRGSAIRDRAPKAARISGRGSLAAKPMTAAGLPRTGQARLRMSRQTVDV